MRSLLLTPREVSTHPVDVGERTEAIILAELVKRGHKCKTGRLRSGVIHFNTVSVRANTKRAIIRHYHGDAELFLVYCPDTGRVYAVDVDEAASSMGSLRVAPAANGQAKGIRWASDHELPA